MAKNIVPGYEQFLLNTDGSITIPHGITDLQHQAIDAPLSPMIITGGVISEGTEGTVTISAITALLRDDTGVTDSLTYITLAEQANQTMASADTKYHVVLDYNSGSPQILIQEASGNRTTQIGLGICMKDTSDPVKVCFMNAGMRLQDGVAKLQRRASTLRATELASGCAIGDVGSATKQFNIQKGVVYHGIHRLTPFADAPHDPYISGDDNFTYVYGDDTAGFTFSDGTDTVIDNVQYWDMAGHALDDVTVTWYGCHWVYIHPDEEHVYVVLGSTNAKLAEAEAAPAPSELPMQIADFGLLLGCIIIQRNATAFTTIQMVTDVFFTGSAVASHSNLSDLDADDHTQYILHSLADAEDDFLVASAADTYVKKTLAETLAILAHTHALAAGATDVTATFGELNLLDLAALTAGELLVATGAATAAWQSTGVKLSAPDISGSVTAASALTLPAHSLSGDIAMNTNELTLDADGDTSIYSAGANEVSIKTGGLVKWTIFNSGNMRMEGNYDFYPATDGQGNFGSGANYFNKLYVNKLSAITLEGAVDLNTQIFGGYVTLSEVAAPGAGAPNNARIYAHEIAGNGGDTELCAVFQGGAVDVFATESTPLDAPTFTNPSGTEVKTVLRKEHPGSVKIVAVFPNGKEFTLKHIEYHDPIKIAANQGAENPLPEDWLVEDSQQIAARFEAEGLAKLKETG